MNNKLQELAAEIARQREKLLQVIAGLSQQQLDFQPSPDSWSIGEVLHHLFLIESYISKMAARLLARAQEKGIGPDPESEGSALHSLDHLREVTSQNKFKAIPQTAPRPGMAKKELLDSLESSREELRKVITEAAKYNLNQLVFPHPYLGEFNLYQWILFTGRHEQRHRGQIRGIVENPAFPKRE
ncbi:MAG: DinB family protein [bacterium]